jgi:hypothetical protein
MTSLRDRLTDIKHRARKDEKEVRTKQLAAIDMLLTEAERNLEERKHSARFVHVPSLEEERREGHKERRHQKKLD